ncbi:MAG: MarR family transcriptional regulator [Flavobacteriales bacterium]|nr:MarR family transcriptional regulator [Flavobacteriales bacterium]MBK7941634.1 MarR family transcriptional regulator [Flavobacteriales bacterium]MBK8949342.1 MarR family transcriptional regulator [Flavobacteriales bacterium]MBK9700177.1 MarR family transcriptional regulator [Flavobacteriales bacterium]
MALKDGATGGLDEHLARLLERIGEVARALRWQQATGARLSPLQIRILGFVAEHSDEAVGVARLSEELQVTRPTVSDSAALLVDRGLLIRKPDKRDGRSHALRLTPAGKRWLPTSGPFTGALTTLPLHEREALLLALMRLLRSLLDSGDVQVQRMCWTCAHYRGDRHLSHHCTLLRQDLAVADLRTDCPDHETMEA